MSFSLASLLVFEEDVPASARRALFAAIHAPASERLGHLEAAARALSHETQLDCSDARELVGLTTS
jgi:hypothetical protein